MVVIVINITIYDDGGYYSGFPLSLKVLKVLDFFLIFVACKVLEKR